MSDIATRKLDELGSRITRVEQAVGGIKAAASKPDPAAEHAARLVQAKREGAPVDVPAVRHAIARGEDWRPHATEEALEAYAAAEEAKHERWRRQRERAEELRAAEVQRRAERDAAQRPTVVGWEIGPDGVRREIVANR
jgi:hypothetical protein